MQSDGATMAPPGTESVAVEKKGVGVRLIAEPGAMSGGGDEGMIGLLEAYSPVFLLFPEVPAAGQGDFEPPHATGARHDYHPRPVEWFVTAPPARSIYVTPGDPLSWVSRLLLAYVLVAAPALPLLVIAGTAINGLAISVFAALVGAAIGEVWLRWRSAPALGPAWKGKNTPSSHRRVGITRLSLNHDPHDAAWKAYREQLASDGAGPKTSYARWHKTPDGELYLQYWQFYVFNDWDNWHEADWEVVMVRLGREVDGHRKPMGAVYSSHLGGLWREWSEVNLAYDDGRLADPSIEADPSVDVVPTHPVVWVALGSHAQYFESMDGHYKARLVQRWGFAQYGGWFSVSSDWTDTLPAEISPDEPERYELRVFPDAPDVIAAPADPWWWLQFGGFWGAHEGIPGPAMQDAKWNDPPRWIEEQCVGDPGVWAKSANV